MSHFEPHSGEGAVSTGPMVVLHDARSVSEARAIVELLDAHQIPALVNNEVDGILLPWQPPQKADSASVLVPSQMLSSARDVLKRGAQSGAFERRRLVPLFGGMRESPSEKPRPQPPPLRVVRDIEPHEDTEDEEIELQLPEPSPLTPRLVVALGVVALGIGLQRVLESMLGESGMLEALAARSPAYQEIYRLVVAGFLHMGPMHFISNAVFGVALGVVLFGTHHVGATALVWLLASMFGLATEATLTPGLALVAGASAGNYGLVGLWAKGQLDRSKVSVLSRREVFRTLGILAILVPGALTPITSSGSRVAVLAHLGGFLAGFLCGFVFKRRLLPEGFTSIVRRSRMAAALAFGLVCAALVQVALLLVH